MRPTVATNATFLGCCCALLIDSVLCSGVDLTVMDRLAKTYTTFQPGAVVDVGANVGWWAEGVKNLWPDAALLMLEANSRYETRLREVANRTHGEFAIGVFTAKEGEVVDFFNGGETGNSMFKEDTPFYANDKPIKKTTLTVDGAVRRSGIRRPVDILKLDIQGAELLALQGATEVLSEATFVQVESSTIVYNIGAPCNFHVDTFLREKGFFLYDMGGYDYNMGHFKTGGVGQYDILYVRPSSDRLPVELKAAKFCTGADTSVSIMESSSVVNKKHGNIVSLVVGFLAGVMFCLIALLVRAYRNRSMKQQL